MKVISNLRHYDIAESIYASGYPMMTEIPQGEAWQKEVDAITQAIINEDFDNPHIQRAISLANAKGGGHNQFLTGCLVAFDLAFTNKGWVEAERYTFLNFVSSQSTMHKISKMDVQKMCSNRVDPRIIDIVNEKIDKYNKTKSLEDYRDLLDNLPSGLILTARMTTNYRCLRNMIEQRGGHRLEVWRWFKEEMEPLPLSKQLIFGEVE